MLLLRENRYALAAIVLMVVGIGIIAWNGELVRSLELAITLPPLTLPRLDNVGRAINPQAIAGQLEGGVTMGMGFALSEELVVKEGVVQNADLARYRIPRLGQVPEMVPIIVEAATSEGPFGAKGVGEITSIPTAPAIINTIHAAAGVRIMALPATPGRVRAATDELRVPVVDNR